MSVRIAGINLNENKNIEIALLSVYGLGRSLSNKILNDLKISPLTKVKDLTEKELNAIRAAISTIPVEGDLRRTVSQNIKRLQDIGSYRGDRHKKRLPLRGQRTRTNARTKRGKRVTMGSGRVALTKT
ncbi:MAG: 30S ribosomal protein S13 [Candidatus Abawacabacteria bacterium]|nr:30S ribosomal protein S13 [Candidatus Abawacabacteria bacterium]